MTNTKCVEPVANVVIDSEDLSTNPSGNRPFADIVETRASRRGLLQGTLAGAAACFLAPEAVAHTLRFADKKTAAHTHRKALVGFEPLSIADATVDQTLPTIAEAYEYQSFIPWGTPIEPGAVKEFDGDPSNLPTSEEAAKQIGIGHDGMAYFPADRFNRLGTDCDLTPDLGFDDRFGRARFGSNRKGMLCVNHEFGTNDHVLRKTDPENLEDVRISQHVHGVSVVAIEKGLRGWEVIKSQNSRRIHVNTPVAFSGPAANSPLLQNPAGNIPMGTVNNCGSGLTPWGTYLTCEENFNGYFGASDGLPKPTDAQNRYGFSATGFGYGWWMFDKRFDLADPNYVNECNRFGWIVEIDPYDATQKPTKRTALGRFKHEAIAIGVAEDGRIAAYMGDDQRFDYCYKFVSAKPWREAIDAGESPLDEGILYVARFNDDGTGDWLELSMAVPALAARFSGMDELLINARIAADIVGATPMDRPEWTTIGQNKSVFWTLTNNSQRAVSDAANPQAPNSDGHIIQTFDSNDFLGTTFTWEIFILASSTRGTPGVFTDPDAAYADPFGRLFIGTDGGQPDGLQDQVVVFDTTEENPEPKRLLVGVVSDELTGWAYTPDFKTAFVNVQHPGNGDPTRTNFPKAFDGVTWQTQIHMSEEGGEELAALKLEAQRQFAIKVGRTVLLLGAPCGLVGVWGFGVLVGVSLFVGSVFLGIYFGAK